MNEGYEAYVLRLKKERSFLSIEDGHYVWDNIFTHDVRLFKSKYGAKEYLEKNKDRIPKSDEDIEVCGMSMTALYF